MNGLAVGFLVLLLPCVSLAEQYTFYYMDGDTLKSATFDNKEDYQNASYGLCRNSKCYDAPPVGTNRPPRPSQGEGGSASESAASAAAVEACVSQYTQLITRCASEAGSIESSCDENKNQETSSLTASLSNMTSQLSSVGASSVVASCNKMAQVAAAANVALTALKKTCSSSISSCTSSCNQASQYAQSNASCLQTGGMNTSEAQEHIRVCSSYTNKVNEMGKALSNALATGLNAQQCAEMASSGLDKFCQKYPTNLACTNVNPNDCSNPASANNKVCICVSNPRSPDCIGAQSVASVDLSSTSIDASSRLDSPAVSAGYDDLASNRDIGMGARTASAYGSPVDGKQGGSGVGSGGAGSAGGASGAGGSSGSPGAALETNVNGGYYGGGRGGAGGVVMAATPGVPGGAVTGAPNAYAGAAGSGPDLRQFLPGGSRHMASRGMGGLTGPDGITGPHTNIWVKIKNRYQHLSHTLSP